MITLFGFFERLWHQYVLGHTITYHQATEPDHVIRDPAGKPLMRVYEQVEFAIPVAHYECVCGEVWQ